MVGYDPDWVLPGVRITRATREPCLVCGHPTGDCTPDSIAHPSPTKSGKITVPCDVYEDRWITPTRQTRILVAAAGTEITHEKARELGLALHFPYQATVS